MKKHSIVIVMLTLCSFGAFAQITDSISLKKTNPQETVEQCFIESTLNTGVGFGIQLTQIQDDFGIGLNVTSPFFLYDRMAVRLRANLMFNEHLAAGVSTLSPYSNISLGLIGVGGKIGDYIRLYGEGGGILILPSDAFSSEDYELGGYGVIGFEFFMSKFNNYFIEIGHVGTGAKENKVVTNPLYSNGMVINAGVRFYLE